MQRKIPTLFGLLMLVAVVGAIIFVFEQFTRTLSSASGSGEPKNVVATNISDTAATITWLTANEASGLAILTAPGQKNITAYDDRDTSEKSLGKYISHSVPVEGLNPETEYSFKILSNGKTYLDNGKPFVVKTGPTLTDTPGSMSPAYGMVTTNDNTPATDAIVLLTVEGGQTLSSLVGKSGTWLIPLNLVRTSSLAQYLPAQERLTETIEVFFKGNTATATTDTLNDSPVPVMEIGKTYDFRRQQAKNPGNPVIAKITPSQPNVLGEHTVASANNNFTVSLTQPAEGSAIPTNLPLFAGTGIPGKPVSLVIGMTKPTGGTATVMKDGTWQYTPLHLLSPGLQSVTITTVNEGGKTVALTHTFTILKSGTQVLGDATPSGTLAPTSGPTIFATPSPTSTLAGAPVPTSGTSLPTILLILFGLAFLGSGAVLIAR